MPKKIKNPILQLSEKTAKIVCFFQLETCEDTLIKRKILKKANIIIKKFQKKKSFWNGLNSLFFYKSVATRFNRRGKNYLRIGRTETLQRVDKLVEQMRAGKSDLQ